ncbi:MAG: hypothetical protein CSA62_11535 [Planctomycetota bacterium]|nr:MAG: hypothetical protein CSA62_11535 [Planctomycetota bacterium]
MKKLRLATAGFLVLAATGFALAYLLPWQDGEEQRARLRFERFVNALCEGNRSSLRWLVSDECAPYVQHMAELDRAKGKQALELLSMDVDGARAIARVRDPNLGAGQQEGEFVLVREGGEWKVDLIASAGRGARQKALPGGSFRVTQTGLDARARFKAAQVMEAKFQRMEKKQGR